MEKDFTLSNPVQIGRIIQSLRDGHQLVGIKFDNRNEGSQSIIVDVDTKQGFFTVDEFPSQACHRLAEDGASFGINAELNGIDVSMTGLSINNVQQDKEGFLYQIEIPRRISYVQRRESFRARVSGLIDVPVDVTLLSDAEQILEAEQAQLEAQLSDISAEGCRLAIAAAAESYFDKNGLELSLKMHFPEEVISIKAETRHQRFLARSKLWYVGCRFLADDSDARTRVERLVIQLQRLERQKNAMFSD